MTNQIPLDTLKPDQLPENMKRMTIDERMIFITQKQEALSPVAFYLGPTLNFFHRVVGVIILCVLMYVIVSLCGKVDEKKGRLTWTELGGHDHRTLRNLVLAILVSVCFFATLGWLMYRELLSPTAAAVIGFTWTLSMFLGGIIMSSQTAKNPSKESSEPVSVLRDDRLYAGVLCSLAVFMMFYFA